LNRIYLSCEKPEKLKDLGISQIASSVRNWQGVALKRKNQDKRRFMNKKTTTALGSVAAAALALGFAVTPATANTGTQSLATVLNVSNQAFDRNWEDYDILTAAVNVVLAAKPDSAVKVLADGNTELTAFIPNDRAFRRLVINLTGKVRSLESSVANDVVGLGVDTVEAVLLYHVVVGAQVPASAALAAGGAVLTTAQTGTLLVNVVGNSIELVDKDTGINNARVILSQVDLNSGNKQIAHGIDRVLLPVKVSK
jgi:uncharacterized surface protein with fasciclin (FAS1) repeats